MAWTAPRTWAALEVVTTRFLNQQIRDDLQLLKTNVDNDGSLNAGLYSVAFSAGAQNSGTGETDLTGFSFSLPANFLAVGEFLRFRSIHSAAQNTNTKTIRLYVNGQATTIWTSAASVAAHTGQTDNLVNFRTATTGGIFGWYHKDCAPTATPTVVLVRASLTGLAWTSVQTIKLTGQGGASADLTQAEWTVEQIRGNGVLQ